MVRNFTQFIDLKYKILSQFVKPPSDTLLRYYRFYPIVIIIMYHLVPTHDSFEIVVYTCLRYWGKLDCKRIKLTRKKISEAKFEINQWKSIF
jgi:hypothetical protein